MPSKKPNEKSGQNLNSKDYLDVKGYFHSFVSQLEYMNPFKYRVWDAVTETFSYPKWWNTKYESDWNRYEAQLYIGVNDRNNKEIYEGDIAQWHGGGNLDKRIGLVRYEGTKFIITGFWLGFQNDPSDCFDEGLHTFEIIGNVFQNQELLNKKVSDEI